MELNIPVLKPSISFDDVYGSGKDRSELRWFVVDSVKASFEHPELFPLGHFRDVKILLCGMPETSMPHIAMAIANEIRANFIPVNCRLPKDDDDGVPFRGKPDQIKAIFSMAEKTVPSVLFLDNIDAVSWQELESQNGGLGYRHQLLDELNKRLDGVIVVAATNRYDLLDIYIIGKFAKLFDIEISTSGNIADHHHKPYHT